MALKVEQKKQIVEQIAQDAASAVSVIVADHTGLTARQVTELRARVRQLGDTRLKVVKDTLAKRAFSGTSYEVLSQHLVGPSLFAFSDKEPAALARLFKSFAKETDKLPVKVLCLEGQVFKGDQLDTIANLPTKQEAIAKLVAVIQAPVTKLVRTFAEPTAKLVRTVAAVGEAKK